MTHYTDRCVAFVDAGYLYGSAASDLAPTDLEASLSQARLLPAAAAESLASFVTSSQGLDKDLVHINWYDGAARGVPAPRHRAIAEQPGIRLRLGFLTPAGQKGVDGLIIADLLQLVYTPGCLVTDVLLVSGDCDLLPAVSAVQAAGIRVHLLGAGTQNQADELLLATAHTHFFPDGFLEGIAELVPAPTVDPQLRDLVARFVTERVTTLQPDELAELRSNHPALKYSAGGSSVSLDGELLHYLSKALDQQTLDSTTRHEARALFWLKLAEDEAS